METIIQFLKNTPTYVYFIFIYLMYVGIKSCRNRVVSIIRTPIIGMVFLYLAGNTIYKSFPDTGAIWGVFLLFLTAGAFLGYLLVYKQKIQVDKKKNLIALPGTWTTIIILFIIFTCKYYIGYIHHEKIEMFQNRGFQFFALGIMGVSSGLFVGRSINYFYRYFTGPYTELTKTK
jgi:hypothetical protein